MPANLGDPKSSTTFRTSGIEAYPDPMDSNPSLLLGIQPRHVILRDRITTATILPFPSPKDVPPSLLDYLCDQMNKEIEKGDTYPMTDTMTTEQFASYWFQNFVAIMLLGTIERPEDVVEGMDFTKQCLGSFYVKPNYPGRSSHVCNGGFLVTDASRAKGVGRLMGETYIDWAPKLGYVYSIFNLVYETNVASWKIWDALGFQRVGCVKGAGRLRSHPSKLIDAIIFGRELNGGSSDAEEDLVSEARFDKIKFYLKHGKYPNSSDRAGKSRLRSAATSYKLGEGDKLMLKGKEVVANLRMQYEIARNVHVEEEHAGINKCTAIVSSRFHWVRIKETVSLAIKNCSVCSSKDMAPREKDTPPAVNDSNPRRRLDVSLDQVSGTLATTTTAEIPISASEEVFGFPVHSNFEGVGDNSGITLEGYIRSDQYPPDQSIYQQQQQHEFHSDYPVDPRIIETSSNPMNEVNRYLDIGELIRKVSG